MVQRFLRFVALTGLLLLTPTQAVFADSVVMDIPVIKQHPELPNGCEITALTSTMKYLGIQVSKMEMAKNYLPMQNFWTSNRKLYAPDPYEFYVGYPWSQGGWFCYAPPIVTAANNYFTKHGLPYNAVDFSKKTQAEFEAALNNNNPIVIWVTREMGNVRRIPKWYHASSGALQIVPVNLHCVVLRGISHGKTYYMDPIRGNQAVNAQVFFNRYNQLGSHAVMIETHSSALKAQSYPLQYDGSILTVDGDSIQPLLSTTFDKSNWFLSIERLAENLGSTVEENEELIMLKSDSLQINFSKTGNSMTVNEKEIPLEKPLLLEKEKYYVSLPEIEQRLNIVFLR